MIYHFSYDISSPIRVSEEQKEEIDSIRKALGGKYKNALMNKFKNFILPTVRSTYYIKTDDIDAQQLSQLLNNLFEEILSEKEKRYFGISIDVCLITCPPFPCRTWLGISTPLQTSIFVHSVSKSSKNFSCSSDVKSKSPMEIIAVGPVT